MSSSIIVLIVDALHLLQEIHQIDILAQTILRRKRLSIRGLTPTVRPARRAAWRIDGRVGLAAERIDGGGWRDEASGRIRAVRST